MAASQREQSDSEKLSDGGSNVSTVGWSECFLSTLSGKAIGEHGVPAPSGPLSRETIVSPFNAAFEPAGDGGCPEWHR